MDPAEMILHIVIPQELPPRFAADLFIRCPAKRRRPISPCSVRDAHARHEQPPANTSERRSPSSSLRSGAVGAGRSRQAYPVKPLRTHRLSDPARRHGHDARITGGPAHETWTQVIVENRPGERERAIEVALVAKIGPRG